MDNKIRFVEHVNRGRMWKVRIYHVGGSPKKIELIDVDDGKVLPLDWESFAYCVNELKRIRNGSNKRSKPEDQA